MLYEVEVEIALPRDKVSELIMNPDNMPHWQEGFVSIEHFEGEPDAVGSKSHIKYKMGKRALELDETITRNDMPELFEAIYETKGVWNKITNRLEALEENRTRWVQENDFKGTNLIMKVLMVLMPGAFKKQSLKYLQDFKAFAEDGTSLADK